jgi:hypothetical protein
MNRNNIKWALSTAIAAILVGCGHKGATTELEKAANSLAKADAAEPAPAPAPQPASTPESPAPLMPAVAPAPPPAQQVKQALAAYKAGELEDAVIRLQKLRATPALTPQQRMALQDSIAAVMTEIYTLAEKGDKRAMAAVIQYERMQTAPH